MKAVAHGARLGRPKKPLNVNTFIKLRKKGMSLRFCAEVLDWTKSGLCKIEHELNGKKR